MTGDPGLERLAGVEHVVVLMMENRSFDHMLGYLTRDGMPEVDGLTGEERNFDGDGTPYPIHRLGPDQTAFHRPGEPLDKSLDPCHSKSCVQEQIGEWHGERPGGFVKNFVDRKQPPVADRGLVMGHYGADQLPVYDFLARQYCVCDAWHSSVPGDTWPNRLYAMAGREAEAVRPDFVKKIAKLFPKPLGKLNSIPMYDVASFTRELEDRQWRWYSHDPATLRVADSRYRDIRRLARDNFAFYDRKRLSVVTEAAEALIVARDSFLDDVAKGQLRDVSWIDPNFVDLSVLDPNSNDDHPPSDVRAGQALVLEIYEALRAGPQWQSTVLVVVYDEHGGFYDHVDPPAIEDDGSGHRTLGVRVPALVVGPRVAPFVCHQRFDHTSLIKTILLRFAKDPEAAIARMGPRVAGAAHLGVTLADGPRTDLADHADVRERMQAWRSEARAVREGQDGRPSVAADGAGQPFVLHHFQEEFYKSVLALREAGLPPGQP